MTVQRSANVTCAVLAAGMFSQAFGVAAPPACEPYVLSPATHGLLLEDVWPGLAIGEETIPEIQRKVKTLAWAQAAVEAMRREADEIIVQPPRLPVEAAGWRHDFYSRATAEHLQCDPGSPDRYLDPLTGRYEADPAQRRAWVLLSHERTFRIMRSLGVLYRLTGDERYARWVADGMRQAADYFTHVEFRRNDVGGPAHYFSNLYDAAVLAQLANAYGLTRTSPAYSATDHAHIREQIFAERMPTMAEFLRVRPTHNMACFVSLALASAGTLFDRLEWSTLALGEQTGLRRQLLVGVPTDAQGRFDGFWYEGTMFYHFYSLCPLIGLWEMDRIRPGGGAAADAGLRARYSAMFAAPVAVVDAQLRLPLVGDLGAPRVMNLARYRHLYEYAAGRVDPERFGPVLSALYQQSGLPRNGLAALAYGPDSLSAPGGIPVGPTCLPVAGLGVFRAPGPEQLYVTFRCGKYVGGHDHPDRLTVALNAFGEPLSPDLGEPGYSLRDAKTNLSYFRTTLAHNTLFVDETEQTGTATLDWQADATPPRATGIIAAQGVRYMRTVIVDPPYVILLDDYQAEQPHRFGWVFHAFGPVTVTVPVVDAAGTPALDFPAFPDRRGFNDLRDRHTGVAGNEVRAFWRVTPELGLRASIVGNGACEVTSATAPGQPYPDTQGALILRASGTARRFATVLEPQRGDPASTVARLALDAARFTLVRTDGAVRHYAW